MTEFIIDLPDTFDVESRGRVVTVQTADVADVIAQAAMHGIKQKVADAAAGAVRLAAIDVYGVKEVDTWTRDALKEWTNANADAVADMAESCMTAALDKLIADGWSTAGRGTAVDAVRKKARELARLVIRREMAKDAYKRDFTAATAAEANARLDHWLDNDARATQIWATAETRVAEDAEIAKLAG